MAQIDVFEATLQVTTVNLTRKVLNQLPRVGYEQIKHLLTDRENFDSKHVVGWIHGSVLKFGNDYDRWLLIKLAPGAYGLFEAMKSTTDKFKQIIVS